MAFTCGAFVQLDWIEKPRRMWTNRRRLIAKVIRVYLLTEPLFGSVRQTDDNNAQTC